MATSGKARMTYSSLKSPIRSPNAINFGKHEGGCSKLPARSMCLTVAGQGLIFVRKQEYVKSAERKLICLRGQLRSYPDACAQAPNPL